MATKEIITWDELSNGTLYCNLIDLSEESQKTIINENSEYLNWNDGSEISKNDLIGDFMLLKLEDGTYSLTMKDEDFYINDIIFSE